MTSHLVLAGDEPWDTMNGVWALIKDNDDSPDFIYILAEEKDYIDDVKDDIRIMIGQYGLETEIETDVVKGGEPLVEKINNIVDSEKEEIVLDITGGTKYLSAQILIHSHIDWFDHIYCLFYLEQEHMRKPYPLIENSRIVLKDLKKDPEGE